MAETAVAVKVLVAGDRRLLVDLLAGMIEGDGYHALVVTAIGVDDVAAAVKGYRPAVVDLRELAPHLPLVPQITALGVPVMVMTATADERVMGAALDAGASAVFGLTASPAEVLESLREVVAGRSAMRPAERDRLIAIATEARATYDAVRLLVSRLTPREYAVLQELAVGNRAETIAAEHHVSIATVRSHIRAILTKLEVSSQLEAVAIARTAGLSP